MYRKHTAHACDSAQGTYDDLEEVDEDDAEWREYHFKVKPGDVTRRPAIISPYHYRLDWLMWFLPFSDPRRSCVCERHKEREFVCVWFREQRSR